MNRASLVIDGKEVPWKSLEVERSLTATVGTWRAEFPFAGRVPFMPGGRALISAAGGGRFQRLLIGFVDVVQGRRDSGAQGITLAGRDRTSDFVDGVQIGAETVWIDANLLQVARGLALPMGLEVEDRATAGEKKIGRHVLQPGETAFSSLERAARRHGVLIGTTLDGKILLGADRTGSAASQISSGEGGNVLAWSWSHDHSSRFRTVRVLGQNDGGLGTLVGALAVPAASAVDEEIRGQRERVHVAQGQVTQDDCERLAAWHVNVSRARSMALEVVLQGWRQAGPDSDLWRPGLRVQVRLDEVAAAGPLLIAGVRLTANEGGETAVLRLVRPESLEADPSVGVGGPALGLESLI